MHIRLTTISLRTVVHCLGILVIVLLLLGYVKFQARNILTGPVIILNDTHTVAQSEPMVTLTGTAQNIVRLTLNGKEIYTNKDGGFSEELVLERGYTIVTLAAQDRFGRTTSLSREFVHVPFSTDNFIGYNSEDIIKESEM